MKKWFFALAAILGIFLVATFIFIPSTITVSSLAYSRAGDASIMRCLSQENNWHKWWPAKESQNHAFNFRYNGNNYRVKQSLFNGFEIAIGDGSATTIISSLRVLPLKVDSTVLEWRFVAEPGNNPLKRISDYQLATSLKKDIDILLDSLENFLSIQDNIYGIRVQAKIVTDTLLVATKQIFKTYPTIAEVYTLINDLRAFSQAKGAQEMNPPMVHVNRLDSVRYETMVAIPVNKEISGGKFEVKKMVAGNILVTEIKGGAFTTRKAYATLDQFVGDHRLQSPAIPFESWVTDRMKEADTSKWITRIYYPIF